MRSYSDDRTWSASRWRCCCWPPMQPSPLRTARRATLLRIRAAADILIAAVGRRNLVTAEMVKPGAVVIDVGTNRTPEGKLAGDVDFDNVRQVAGWISPVPGGVGPMTIAMLLTNTVEAAERRANLPRIQ